MARTMRRVYSVVRGLYARHTSLSALLLYCTEHPYLHPNTDNTHNPPTVEPQSQTDWRLLCRALFVILAAPASANVIQN